MKPPINKILATIPPSGIRKFFEIVAERDDVISLSVGEPDFDAPWSVRESAIAALEEGRTHYTANKGDSKLRGEIAKYFRRKFGVDYDPQEEILVGNGVSEIFDITMRSLLNAGDEVILFSPSYVMYAPLIQLAKGQPVFAKKISEIEKKISPKTRILVLSYPSNPNGETFSKSELEKIAEIIKKHDLFVVSDEIYGELTYEGSHTSFASLKGMKERCATLSGFSKAFALTGLRLGYLLAPKEVVDSANKIHQYSALCANSISQTAALEALRNCDEAVEQMRAEYKLRRDFLVRELNRMGLSITKPKGAFYLFPNVRRKTKLDGEQFALRLLEKEKVAVVPGNAFGAKFADFVRISYATSLADLEIALERMERFIKGLK